MVRIGAKSCKAVGLVCLSMGIFIYVVGLFKLNLADWIIHRNDITQDRRYSFYNRRPAEEIAWKYEPLFNEDEIKKELEHRLKSASEEKIIIIWSPPFGIETRRTVDRWKCGECKITYDRSLINDVRTGAIVHHFDSLRYGNMSKTRNPHHLYIFWTLESPSTLMTHGYTFKTEDEYGMNATMGYRLDSDFLANYKVNVPLDNLMGNSDSIYLEIMKPKRKLAIAVISDCSATLAAPVRLALINNLKKEGLRIDTFGRCFSRFVDSGVLVKSIPQYKFYFAYENSYHCKEYISEKFFHYALANHAVPVVWGATKSDYEKIAPPGSFIFAEEFNSPKHLISYLEFLDKNDDKYLQFFRWRTLKPEGNLPQFGRQQAFCAICRALHGINTDYRFNPNYRKSGIPLFSDGIARRVVPSVRRRLYDEDNKECFTAYQHN